LQLALNWQKKQKPTRSWAQRYDIAFERAIVFLDTSRITYEAELKNQEMLQQRILSRARIGNIILGVFSLVAIVLFFYGLTQQLDANKKAELASKAAEKEKLAAAEAKRQEKEAVSQRNIAEKLVVQIKQQNSKLDKALRDAELAKQRAELNFQEAKRQEEIAQSARKDETKQRLVAETQTQKANEANEESFRLLMLSIAQSLEAKAVGIDDNQLAGLAALQGYNFHLQQKGNKYDPYIFKGLYSALTKLYGSNYNALKTPGNLKNRMYSLALSSKGNTLYTTGNDGKILAGDYLSQVFLKPIISNPFPNRVLALSKDEKYLVNASDSTFIQVFNLVNPSPKPLLVFGHTAFVSDIKFLPDNSGFISVSKDRTIRLNNPETGESKKLLTLPFDLKTVSINSDGSQLAGASVSGKLILVNLKDYSFTIIKDEAPNRILSVSYHPSKPLVAYGTELLSEKGIPIKGSVKIIDLTSLKETKELTGHNAGVSSVEFSPNGLLIASAGLDKKLQMWVVDKEEDLPVVMDNNNGNIWDIVFSPKSDYLIAACNFGEIRVWPTDPKMLADQICPKLTRNMTADEWEKYVGKKIQYRETCVKN
jgi:WD40 repeat protein